MRKEVTLLETPYRLTANPTVKSGNIMALTCTGGITGVPMEAAGVLLGCFLESDSARAFAEIGPHGDDLSRHVCINQSPDGFFGSFIITQLSSNQIDVKANEGNIVLKEWYIFGYVI